MLPINFIFGRRLPYDSEMKRLDFWEKSPRGKGGCVGSEMLAQWWEIGEEIERLEQLNGTR